MPHSYITDGAEIYRQSFAMIRAEADLARFTPEEEIVAVRMIHAAGMVGLEAHIRFSPGMAIAARAALEAGAPILCDARMVSEGITRTPTAGRQRGDLHPARPVGARNWQSAWPTPVLPPRWNCGGRIWRAQWWPSAMRRPRCFHLLNMLEDPACPRPAAIIGCPVGFIGAAESKDALMADLPVPCADRGGPSGRIGHYRGGGQRAGQPEGIAWARSSAPALAPATPI